MSLSQPNAANKILDYENKAANFANAQAQAANDAINFGQTIVAPSLKSETMIGGEAGFPALGFVFDYCGDVKAELDTDITDHFTESAIFIQDHAILKPRMVTLRGFVGELVARPPVGLNALFNTLTGGLTAVDSYLGKNTRGATAKLQKAANFAQTTTAKLNAIAAKGNRILNILGKNVAKSKQAIAWQKLEEFWALRMPMRIFTPTRQYENMMVKSVVWTNPESTKFWSEIIVTMKEIRIAETVYFKSQADTVLAENTEKSIGGVTAGTKVPTTGLKAK